MTIFERIREAMAGFSPIIKEGTYEGPEEDFVTYNYAGDYGADYGDSRPGTTLVSVQIHHFLPPSCKFLEIKKKERRALFLAGFTYPDVTVITDRENGYRHLIYECQCLDDEEVAGIAEE